jgi:hypothetical protein
MAALWPPETRDRWRFQKIWVHDRLWRFLAPVRDAWPGAWDEFSRTDRTSVQPILKQMITARTEPAIRRLISKAPTSKLKMLSIDLGSTS